MPHLSNLFQAVVQSPLQLCYWIYIPELEQEGTPRGQLVSPTPRRTSVTHQLTHQSQQMLFWLISLKNPPVTGAPEAPLTVVPVQKHPTARKFHLVFSCNLLCCHLSWLFLILLTWTQARFIIVLSRLSFYISECHYHYHTSSPLFSSPD